MLLAGVVLKFVPAMVTVVPMRPEVGVKEVMVGKSATPTVKLVALVAVKQFVVTEITPDIVLAGTIVVMLVVVLAVTVAGLLLKNLTSLSAGVVLKLVPVIVTVVPIGPTEGVKLVIEGIGRGTALLNF